MGEARALGPEHSWELCRVFILARLNEASARASAGGGREGCHEAVGLAI